MATYSDVTHVCHVTCITRSLKQNELHLIIHAYDTMCNGVRT